MLIYVESELGQVLARSNSEELSRTLLLSLGKVQRRLINGAIGLPKPSLCATHVKRFLWLFGRSTLLGGS